MVHIVHSGATSDTPDTPCPPTYDKPESGVIAVAYTARSRLMFQSGSANRTATITEAPISNCLT